MYTQTKSTTQRTPLPFSHSFNWLKIVKWGWKKKIGKEEDAEGDECYFEVYPKWAANVQKITVTLFIFWLVFPPYP